MLEVVIPGLISSIQDLGRKNQMHIGVSHSGALDQLSFHLANRLVENPANTPALEIIMPPAIFTIHKDCWIALTGSFCSASLDNKVIWFGRRTQAKKGQTLKIGPIPRGLCCYLAISGGFTAPSLMNSSATDIKAGFGGHTKEGSTLKKGDHLAFGESYCKINQDVGIKLPFWDNTLRVITSAEYSQFTPKSQQSFFEQDWIVANSSNRMGFRLQGKPLNRIERTDILSQGVVRGVIQVPPNGQPIILAAEAQTTGGYPRIGTIIQADLWKLGQAGINQTLKFKPCSIDEAKEALMRQQAYLDRVEYILQSTR